MSWPEALVWIVIALAPALVVLAMGWADRRDDR